MQMLVFQIARQQAKSLLETAWDGEFPVKLGGISQTLDAEVLHDHLPPELSGFIVKREGEDTVHIMLNSTESTERQRFTWAHELGHLIERATLAGDDDYSFVETRMPERYDLHEFFADEFAGTLLMPAPKIRELQARGITAAGMAAFFGVSLKAMRKRLDRLKKQPDAD
ncbi:ImmA/IrrE family metallo-endopeptidase [Brachybacterium equifaecis]|uniref:ImmA/IrrE family metallo-endopeptidase n=1 Tax=Brachybacterium equifaecis TaxID=2910770 RepID=UPI0024BEF483|nr:ImmA/IrrE family metallo-endopeptidase [Brachybacterium equifaecis]